MERWRRRGRNSNRTAFVVFGIRKRSSYPSPACLFSTYRPVRLLSAGGLRNDSRLGSTRERTRRMEREGDGVTAPAAAPERQRKMEERKEGEATKRDQRQSNAAETDQPTNPKERGGGRGEERGENKHKQTKRSNNRRNRGLIISITAAVRSTLFFQIQLLCLFVCVNSSLILTNPFFDL